MMNSLDLNLIPTADAAASYGAGSSHIAPTQIPFIVPKLEPKLEPHDESLAQTHLQLHFLQGPNPNLTLGYPPHVSPPVFRPGIAEQVQNNGNVGGLINAAAPEENRLATAPSRRRRRERLSSEDDYFRSVVRNRRMLYNSLQIMIRSDAEEQNNWRTRSDRRPASAMKERRYWLNPEKRILGSIPGIVIGDTFFYRTELCVVGLHGQAVAKIDYLPPSLSPDGEPVITSIVVCGGGYEECGDDVITYTCRGGRYGERVYIGGNLGRFQIRVIRGLKCAGSPSGNAYVYNGLFRIVDAAYVGKSGGSAAKTFMYKLVRIENQHNKGTTAIMMHNHRFYGDFSARPYGNGLHVDISGGKERVPVLLLVDDGDRWPALDHYTYITRAFAASDHPDHHSVGPAAPGGCDCVGGCNVDGTCACAMENGGHFAYSHRGLLVRGKPLIFECGPGCSCPPNCKNRVSQTGLRYMLGVFKSKETGCWGVRSLDLIQAGSFICEYAGRVLTKEQLVLSESTTDNKLIIHPDRFDKKWIELGDLSKLFPDYFHPEHPPTPPLDFALDVSKFRNVASYIAHSRLSPNVMVQFVNDRRSNSLFPRLMLFALETIPPLRELTLDYGTVPPQTPAIPPPLRRRRQLTILDHYAGTHVAQTPAPIPPLRELITLLDYGGSHVAQTPALETIPPLQPQLTLLDYGSHVAQTHRHRNNGGGGGASSYDDEQVLSMHGSIMHARQ